MVAYVLAENIVNPLLNVIEKQMQKEYGQRIDAKKIWEKLAMPRGMLSVEESIIYILSGSGNRAYKVDEKFKRALRQYRVE
jgi:hypothetical protein